MGVYGFGLLDSDYAWQTIQAIKEEFGINAEDGFRDVSAAEADEMAKWAVSSKFTAKAFASKDARVVFLAAQLMQDGGAMSPKLKQRVARDADTLAWSHPDSTAREVYCLDELVSLLGGYWDGIPVLVSGSMGELLRRDAVTDPAAGSARTNAFRWVAAGNGSVRFADASARGRAGYPLDKKWVDQGGGHRIGVRAPLLPGSDKEVLEALFEAARRRPPFNLRLRGDHALWADLQAVTHDVAEGTPCDQALAGVAARLSEVEGLLRLSEPDHDPADVPDAAGTAGTSASCKP